MPKVVQDAFAFADNKHEGQVRLYSHEQYINHPMRVAQQLIDWQYTNPVTLQVALLHDVLEDTPCTISELVRNFGHEVAAKVRLLTESQDPLLSRADRKLLHNHILRSADDDVQIVKIADISDNIADFSTMHAADSKFAKVYLEEKKVTLLSLSGRYGFSERHELLKTIQTLEEEFNLR